MAYLDDAGSYEPKPRPRCGRRAKYSENRDFAPRPPPWREKLRRQINWLEAKFVTRWINGIYAPINEFGSVNNRITMENAVSYDNRNSKWTMVSVSAISNPGNLERTECRPGRRAITRWVMASRRGVPASRGPGRQPARAAARCEKPDELAERAGDDHQQRPAEIACQNKTVV